MSDTNEPSAEKPNETEATAAPATDAASEESLETVMAARDRLKDQLLRTAADFDNYRKRVQKDLADARRKSKEDVIREVLPIIDNLERAVAAAGTATDAKAVADGVRMVLRSFEDVAQRIELERLTALGQRFDPALHDAVQQVETDEHEPGTVVSEIAAGYRFDQKLLRPALVVVARPKPKVTPEA